MSDTIVNFYGALGFEQTEIEDNLVVLGIEVSATGDYALLTDDNGKMPDNLNQPVTFACYTPDDAYLWNAGFKNSALFKEVWETAATIEEKLAAIRQYREGNEVF